MREELTANRVRSMAIGIMVAAVFGSGWLFWSLVAWHKIGPGTATCIWVGTLALLAGAAYVMKRARRWPLVTDDPGKGRAFAWITAIEWIAMAAVAFGFKRMRWELYLPSAVTMIVGLHYYPLARLFRNPIHYGTGTLLVAWAAASALILPADQRQGVSTLGTGAILWASAVVTLGRAMHVMRVGAALTRAS